MYNGFRVVVGVLALALMAGCQRSYCPTNQAQMQPAGSAQKMKPAKSSGTYDANGRFVKKNAYHPSKYQANE